MRTIETAQKVEEATGGIMSYLAAAAGGVVSFLFDDVNWIVVLTAIGLLLRILIDMPRGIHAFRRLMEHFK